MNAFVIEAVVRLPDVVFVVAFSVDRISRLHAALRIHTEAIMIADCVMNLQAQILLRPVIHLEQAEGPLLRNPEPIEDVVSSLDREVHLMAAHSAERHRTARIRI